MILITTALTLEALPIIQMFQLKKTNHTAFHIYQNASIKLIVTGMQKIFMAAGTAFIGAITENFSAFLNIGTAGHKDLEIGTAVLAHKITDKTLKKNFYPHIGFSWDKASSSLLTLDQLQENYLENTLHDMEASAFYSTALRFKSCEDIHVLKIVSDNEKNPFSKLSKEKVSSLIEKNASNIQNLIDLIQKKTILKNTLDITPLLHIAHFTTFQKNRAKELASHLFAIHPSYTWDIEIFKRFKRAKHILEYLEKEITKRALDV